MEDGVVDLQGIGKFIKSYSVVLNYSRKSKNMKKGIVINSLEVKTYKVDNTYSSKMLLDNIIAGEETIQINEGTLKGNCKTGGAIHKKSEIYYIVKGEAILHLDEEKYDIKPGSLVFIPSGVFHSLDNKSKKEDFVILTFWLDASENEVYINRIKEWGKSFKTIYED
jgi:mannose-6-phosphate isomerase-like protein (cupin superfamily)